ncbi:MAG: hypothetical protein ACRC8S_08220 [Fimbriiglobus sp.]
MKRCLLMLLFLTPATVLAGVFPPLPMPTTEGLHEIEKLAKSTAKKSEGAPEDPSVIAERIAKNGKQVTDRLHDKDSGKFTQKTQKEILEDIDKLLKNDNPPPPMSENSDQQHPESQGGQGGKSSPMGGSQKPLGGMPPPMGGSTPKPMGGQSRSEQRKQQRAQEQGMNPMPMAPMPSGMGKDGMKPMGAEAGMKPIGGEKGGDKPMGGMNPGDPSQRPPQKPGVPFDDTLTKEIWGHLPDRLRQEMSQYYKEQFMPRYNDMLRQYYNRLADREKPKK